VFLAEALGLKVDELGREESGAVRSASLRAGDGRVLVQPDLPEELHGSHLGQGRVYVTVADIDADWARARDAGAQVPGDRTVRRTARFAATAPATRRAACGASAPTAQADNHPVGASIQPSLTTR
jgi:hypothetical protein